MVYIGIDPGSAGGIVVLGPDGIARLVEKMPTTEMDLFRLLIPYGAPINGLTWPAGIGSRAALEHVWSIPGQGGAFKFGKNVGHLEMVLTAAGIPFDRPLPKQWQRAIGVAYPPGATDTEKKNITKRRAQQLFPTLTVTHAIADALLIAEFCRRSHRGSDGETKDRQTVKEAGAQTEGSDQAARKRKPYEGYNPPVRTRHRAAAKRSTVAGAPRNGAGQKYKAR